jgi:hypothetical protein
MARVRKIVRSRKKGLGRRSAFPVREYLFFQLLTDFLANEGSGGRAAYSADSITVCHCVTRGSAEDCAADHPDLRLGGTAATAGENE